MMSRKRMQAAKSHRQLHYVARTIAPIVALSGNREGADRD